ncbi:MAG: 3-dehydroquinate synthase [Bacteroidetes bacterium]|nr:3-dehydroquinate synthase [Bacteroidota bacterium]
MKTVEIKLSQNPYKVLVGEGIFENLSNEISKKKLTQKRFFIIDKNVNLHYAGRIRAAFPELTSGNSIVLEAKESKKSFESLFKIYSKLLKENYGRDSLIIAIGGGIIGDVTGFAAATYMRGIKLIHVPTTLLSSVDSSVGGKTGVNFGDTKNIVGAFYQPELVLIDTSFFKTLSKGEVISGIGEVIKYGFLSDTKFYNYLKKNLHKLQNLDDIVLEKVIMECVKLKGSVVISDEKESGIRKVLNLGHTFAHAIEVDQNYKIKHGQAVIAGISCAMYLSCKLNFITENALNEYFEIINALSSEIKIAEYNFNKLYALMRRDKKNRESKIKFVLIGGVGEIVLDAEANKSDVEYAVKCGLKIFTKR